MFECIGVAIKPAERPAACVGNAAQERDNAEAGEGDCQDCTDPSRSEWPGLLRHGKRVAGPASESRVPAGENRQNQQVKLVEDQPAGPGRKIKYRQAAGKTKSQMPRARAATTAQSRNAPLAASGHNG